MPESPPGPAAESITAKPKSGRKFSLLVTFILLFGAGLFVGRYVMPASEFTYTDPLQFVSVEGGQRQLIFPTYWEAWDHLQNSFIGELDDTKLFYGAVAGMVRAAGDDYTVFSPPADTKQFEETINGSFSGVGIEIGFRNGVIAVIAPLDGSPASKAGVRAGDIIVGIDDEPVTQEMSLDDVVQNIRGQKGQPVKLTVVHEGEGETTDIDIKRGKIEIESVKLNIDDQQIAYLEITNFNSDTAKRFTEAAREAKRKKAAGLIIDVRNNPGGFLQSAVDISSTFLPRKTLVVSEKGRQNKEYLTRSNPILPDIPLVVIVNGGSASASEILAGALRDNLNVPIIGTQTFGKGSVQEFIKLKDNSSLRVTVAKWFTPNGTSIDEDGIAPNIEVEQDPDTEADEQFDRAHEEITKLIQSP